MASIGDGDFDVNAVADVSTANRLTRRLEDLEAMRQSQPVRVARSSVARRLGVAPGTLENIRRLRTKIVPNWLMARIRAAFVAELHSEIARLEHEIHIARQIGTDTRDDVLVAAETQLATAKKLLGS